MQYDLLDVPALRQISINDAVLETILPTRQR